MFMRTVKSTMTFTRPFELEGFDETLPPGTYGLEADEDILEGMFLPDCLRTTITLQLLPKAEHPGLSQRLTVPWEELDVARWREAVALAPRDAGLLGLDDLLSAPLIRLMMRADRVKESVILAIFSSLAIKRRVDVYV
ncbi:hypothetical protein [Pseudokordiimonas caeni]|uniref:hypothetical protein n=1 Tax=Pseudokordiimonas caeni TaxID=2997908 RepID=UPI0028114F8F|nr:hypothetical protein [Pseudokordiimonas caeni]